MVMGGDVVGAGFDVVTGESLPLSLVEVWHTDQCMYHQSSFFLNLFPLFILIL